MKTGPPALHRGKVRGRPPGRQPKVPQVRERRTAPMDSGPSS